MVQWTDKKHKNNPAQLTMFVKGSYLERTSRPIYAMAFLIPFIIVYEVGTLAFNTGIDHSQIRVVSFVWIQQMLGFIGFSPNITWIGAPLAVLVILFAMQITAKAKWRLHLPDFAVMTVECIILAMPLIVLSLALNRPEMKVCQGPISQSYYKSCSVKAVEANQPCQVNIADDTEAVVYKPKNRLMGIIVTGIGAGIYEELVFRLVLIGLLAIIFQDVIGIKHNHAIITAVILSSLFFSLHHYLIFLNGRFSTPEKFALASFSFRTIAGIYFAILYTIRGYGITAGTHAFYDIIIAVLNTVFFHPEQ